MSLDETALSKGELYTILTNKAAKGQKGAIIAIVKGTKAEDIIKVLSKISVERRNMVKEVTVDMAGSMNLIAKKCFPKTDIVTDRFHVQKLALDAVQEIRIKIRWSVMDAENKEISQARKDGLKYIPKALENGDTQRQLLARSRYALFKAKSKWSPSQIERTDILFNLYPEIEQAYNLAQKLSYIYENNTDKDVARTKLALWYNPDSYRGGRIWF